MIRISPSCLKTIRRAVRCEPRVLVTRAEPLGEIDGALAAVSLPEVDVPRIAAMLASGHAHEDDLPAVGREVAVDCVVDPPALAEACEPLRPEVVEIKPAVPRIIVRVAVEQEPAAKLRGGVGPIRGLVAGAAPRALGWQLAFGCYGSQTLKIGSRDRRDPLAIVEAFCLAGVAAGPWACADAATVKRTTAWRVVLRSWVAALIGLFPRTLSLRCR